MVSGCLAALTAFAFACRGLLYPSHDRFLVSRWSRTEEKGTTCVMVACNCKVNAKADRHRLKAPKRSGKARATGCLRRSRIPHENREEDWPGGPISFERPDLVAFLGVAPSAGMPLGRPIELPAIGHTASREGMGPDVPRGALFSPLSPARGRGV